MIGVINKIFQIMVNVNNGIMTKLEGDSEFGKGGR